MLFYFFFLCGLSILVMAVPLRSQVDSMTAVYSSRGYDISIQRRKVAGAKLKRDGFTGSVSLGDDGDLLYTVPIILGDTTMAVHLDTGSSDLWVISDACASTPCSNATLARYSTSSFNASGSEVTMNYGDSKTGTYASGPIGSDVAAVAGIAMPNQQFAAINATTNPILNYGASGILGVGFPSGSLILDAVVDQYSGGSTTDALITGISSDGPLLARMAMSGQLAQPMFAISLQRDTIEISGNGVLSVGQLPNGVDESSLTWVPVRLYSQADGGWSPPTSAPSETYPYRWEIEVDGVYVDGNLMPQSTIPGNGVTTTTVSALIDTGNSLIRGPSDVVQKILTSISPTYTGGALSTPTLPCSTPHTLAFKIGGQMFPIDPANLITPYMSGNAQTCVASEIVATDPPGVGALFSWSLGDPFLKSNLVAFYYGNLTNPSVDPPRIGLLSTVPANADAALQQAVASASADGGTFASTIQYAPTASAADAVKVTILPTTAVTTPTSSDSPTPVPSTMGSLEATGSPTNTENSSHSLLLRPDTWLAVLCPLILLSFRLL